MHDLNSALEGLRQVMPYSNGPNVKKLSKMSTLLLARNYIVMLTRSLDEMKKLVQDLSANKPVPMPTMSPTAPIPDGRPTAPISDVRPTAPMADVSGIAHVMYPSVPPTTRYSPYKVPSSPYSPSTHYSSTPTRIRHHPYGRISSTPLSDSTNIRPELEPVTSTPAVPHKFSVASLLKDTGSSPKVSPPSAQVSSFSENYGLGLPTGQGHISPYTVPKFDWKL
ncbi:hypothetical protein FSP39_015046 [Pinctada imbricata]|uniref:BHLH domain-containing protein n=1 Tax=Pinctada imbricata TaxID=66713 RepID=A0AA88YF58_PINIB|nr:hypothetical protein FSP39_015046 [Pinctada imbricata]